MPEASVVREDDFTLHSSIDTLGHHVVAAMNRHAELIHGMATEDLSDTQRTALTNFVGDLEQELPGELDEVRTYLRGLDKKATDELGFYLDEAIPLFFHRSIPGAELVVPPPEWRKWLADETSDAELLNFLQWHNHVSAELARSEGVQAIVARHRGQCVEASRLLIEYGYFSPSTNLEDTASVVYGDIFDTHLRERAAYYTALHHRITFGQSMKGTETSRTLDFINDLMSTGTHEQAHAMLCRTRESHTSPLGERWVNEALTQEASRMIRAALRDPNLKTDRVYEDERSLLTVLLSMGDKTEGMKRALRAYTGDQAERDEFTDYLDEIWGTSDVMQRVNSSVLMAEEFFQQHGKKGREAETEALQKVILAFKTDPKLILNRGSSAPAQLLKDVALE